MCAEAGKKEEPSTHIQVTESTGGGGVILPGNREEGEARRQSGPENVCYYVCLQCVRALELWVDECGRRLHSCAEAGQILHRQRDGFPFSTLSPCFIKCDWFPMGNRCRKGKDPRLGKGGSPGWAGDEEGWASVPKRRGGWEKDRRGEPN